MTIKSMDAANRVLLRSSIDFIKIIAQQAYLPLRPCKKDRWADNSGGYCIAYSTCIAYSLRSVVRP
jgi:hypothetical protein